MIYNENNMIDIDIENNVPFQNQKLLNTPTHEPLFGKIIYYSILALFFTGIFVSFIIMVIFYFI